MMNNKSEAFYRYRAEQARGTFPYFESDEIEQIVYDLLDDDIPQEALDVLEQGLKLHPGNESLIKMKVLILIHQKCLGEAHELFAPFENDGTEASETLKFAFEVVHGRSRSALRGTLSKLRKKTIQSVDFVNLIDEMWNEIDEDVKMDYLEPASQIISDSSEALARIGAMFMDLNCYAKAIPVFERALDIDAYDIYTWQDMVRCCFELMDFDKCMEACEFGIAIDPENPLFNFVRGFILLANKQDYKNALESLLICKKFFEGDLKHEVPVPPNELEAQHSLTYDLLGQCYSNLDETDESIKCYEKLIARMPENHEAMFDLTREYLDKGDLPKGLDMINRAIRLDKKNTKYLSIKASILASMHYFDEAMETMDKLIKLKPGSMNFVLAKAELALGTHQYEMADKEFRKLLGMKPEEPMTKAMMREYFLSIGDAEALKEIDNL